MTSSISSVRQVIKNLRQQEDLSTKDGISLLSLKHHLLLSYLQNLLLLSSHRAIGHTLTERSPPSQPFSHPDRDARGADAGDLVDSMVESRVVLEKVKALESRMRYQIEKLVRTAQEPEKAAIDDPLAFRPNPQNLVDNDGNDSDQVSDDDRGKQTTSNADGIYRPPRLAPVPYSTAPKTKTKRAAPVPTALRSLHDPTLPHAETTTGLGNTPSLLSGRAKHLKRIQEFEEENFGRIVMGKGEGKRRARDEEDMALGAELGGARGVGKNRRRGGLEDEFGDVLRNVERGMRGSRGGDGYDELRKNGRRKNVLERAKANVRVRDEPDEEVDRPRKKTRFEQAAKHTKKKLKKA
ncbi:hypothetical protein FB45DRAFT_981937 [Roridomyces roridus]|uniref:Uncharacterized protein n=1 Tax=Roridomyces roridus TaxID=1738132 RepID=A0AAD7B5Q6_9AGAR|nr:hypothetical protein FB45DRAFT_981937 [Roridomyces roridus]